MMNEVESPPSGEIAGGKTKSDRALAVLRSLPIHRMTNGALVLLTDADVIPIPSMQFSDAAQAAWVDLYCDQTLSAGSITRALASLKADRTIPKTDREPAPAEPKRVAAQFEWQLHLVTDSKGDAVDCVANVTTVFRHHPAFAGNLRYNAFQQCIVLTRELPFARPSDAPAEWIETDDTRMQEWVQRELHFQPSKAEVADALAVVAEEHSFHPVREYLDAVGATWDEEERLPTMLANYFGARPGAYTAGVGTAWMISAVARVMRPGCQADYMIGLEGAQGAGKSTGLRTLCPEASWYSDTGITIGQKDSYIALHGKWIYCFDELSSMKGSDVTKTKNFLTSISDSLRPPYGRRNRDYPRQTIFAYTTNESVYLKDRTGNRRSWPVLCTRKIDADAIAEARDQLWAEAVVRYRRGEKWWPDASLEALCKDEQEQRVIGDPWADIIGDWLATPVEEDVDAYGHKTRRPVSIAAGVTSAQVLTLALGKRAGDITRADEMRVAEVLRELGWEHDPARPRDKDGRRVRIWTRTNQDPTLFAEVGPSAA